MVMTTSGTPAPDPTPGSSSARGAPGVAPGTTTPGIGIVVVTYEAVRHVARCLASLRPLTAAGHEVVVVDNASSDGSARCIRDDFAWARLIALDRNLGFAAACNVGAAATAREHLLLLNPDAWVDAGCVEALADALARDPRLGAVAPRLFYRDGRRQFSWEPTPSIAGEAARKLRNRFERWPIAHRPARAAFRALGDRGWLTAACLMVRREAWDAVGGFDERYFLYFEDADLGLRLRRAGFRLGVEPRARAWHLSGASRSPAAEVHYRRSQFLFYREHRPRWENRALLRRSRRRFARVADSAQRAALLAVCDEAEAVLATDSR
jgi:N-acetylglucosaminyl-diphospho-decaprenol L-rhamnosyltransferase